MRLRRRQCVRRVSTGFKLGARSRARRTKVGMATPDSQTETLKVIVRLLMILRLRLR